MSMQVVPVKFPISISLVYGKVLYTTYIDIHHMVLATCLSSLHSSVPADRLLSAPGDVFPA